MRRRSGLVGAEPAQVDDLPHAGVRRLTRDRLRRRAILLLEVARAERVDWDGVARRLADAIGAKVAVETLKDHAIFRTTGRGDTARTWLIDNLPEAIVLSQGQSIEIFKGVGSPNRIIADLVAKTLPRRS